MSASKFFGEVPSQEGSQRVAPQAFYLKEKLTKTIPQQYVFPFQEKPKWFGPWSFARAMAGERAHFEEFYNKREKSGENQDCFCGAWVIRRFRHFFEKWQKMLPHVKVLDWKQDISCRMKCLKKVHKPFRDSWPNKFQISFLMPRFALF
ncbi:MAG: hypothetical protein ACO1OQ_03255 [Rufibacter sp.]